MTLPNDWKPRNSQKPKITDKKLRGEWAELCFMVRAAEQGLQLSMPWGEMRSYDFIVGRPRHFVAVQVKSTILEIGTGYACTVQGGHKPYPPGSFDFLAAYVVNENAWYIIPEEHTWGKKRVSLYPNAAKSKYAKYREAWHLLNSDQDSSASNIDIQACAEEFSPDWLQ
jgi:PD-(D/E)XK nuclease superfamily protein